VIRVYKNKVKIWPDKPLFVGVYRNKWVRRFASLVGIGIVLLWAALYATSQYKRSQAERLLRDLSALPADISLNSALKFAKRYGGGPLPGYACNEHLCILSIAITNYGPKYMLAHSTLFDYVGLRPWEARAGISVHERGPISTGYTLLIGRGRGELHHSGMFSAALWAWLDAGFDASDTRLQKYTESLRRRRYTPWDDEGVLISKPCLTTYGGGEALQVLTPSRPDDSAKRVASNIHFRCLTGFRPCTEMCQVMPDAWREFVSHGAHGCNMDSEALERARRACGDWAGNVGVAPTVQRP
jgi:hypothetical protein